MGHHPKEGQIHKAYKKEDALIVSQELNQTSKASHQHKFQVKSLSEFDNLSYKSKILFLAGVFDGEGSFGIWSRGKNLPKRVEVKVETTDADMVSRFYRIFKGSFYASTPKNKKHRHLFRWKITGEKALKFLEQVIPFMCRRRREKYYGMVQSFRNGS